MILIIKWNGKGYSVDIHDGAMTVLELKNVIEKETGVKTARQKLLNLKLKGKPVENDTLLSALNLQDGAKIMMMGSLEENIVMAQTIPDDLPPVINDLDIPDDEEVAVENRAEYLQKVERRVQEYEVKILNSIRPDKKLLVLDIDYTLFDHRSTAETGTELMRPYLHEFLTSAYQDYDLVIWSATSMKWIEEKMKLLGVNSHPAYKIAFYLDSNAMITVHTERYGVVDVKPLGVIWGKFSHYSARNTIMFDDLRRNFLMNPHNGLKIRPFRQAHQNRATDRELLRLSKYLKDISTVENISALRHSRWEDYRKGGYQ